MRLQSIEIAARSALLRSAVTIFGGPRRPLPDWKSGRYRVLFLRDDGIGDLILSVPVMQAIAASAPGFSLDVLCSPQNARLSRLLPFANDVLVHRRGSVLRSASIWRELRARRYDVVIDGRVSMSAVNTQTTALLLATGSPWRVGIADRRNAQVYTVPVQPSRRAHVVELLAELARPFGIDPQRRDWQPEIPMTPAQRRTGEENWDSVGAGRPRVLLNYSAGAPDRQWPADRYAALATHLRSRLPHATIMVVGVPADAATVNAVAQGHGTAARTPDLDTLIALISASDLVITPDTAVTHIAAAFHRTTIALMLPGYELFAPYCTPGRTLVSESRTMEGISVARAAAAVDDVTATFARSA
jgi:ADP-heptose:LPS heptosyltransferase